MTRADEPATESLMGHLLELRARLLRSVIAVLLLFGALFPFSKTIYAWFAEPLLVNLPDDGVLQSIDPAGPFFITVKLVFFIAVMIAMP